MKRNFSLASVIKWILFVSLFIFLSIFIFFIVDSDEGVFLLFLQGEKAKEQQSVSSSIADTGTSIEDQDILNGVTGDETQSVSNATDADIAALSSDGGLNLLLINNIGTKDYVKDLLSLMRDSQLGLVTPQSKYHVPVSVMLGATANEVNLISGLFPKFYFPITKTGNTFDFAYNRDYMGVPASQMTFNTFDIGAFRTINTAFGKSADQTMGLPSTSADFYRINPTNGAIGPFQAVFTNYTSANMSKLNGATNSNRTKPDFAFYPDNLAALDSDYLNGRILPFIGDTELSKLTAQQIGAIYSQAHNRGNIVTQLFGCATTKGNITRDIWDRNNLNKKLIVDLECTLVDDVDAYINQKAKQILDSDMLVDSGAHRWFAVFCCLEFSEDWFISQKAYTLMKSSTTAKNVYAIVKNKRASEVSDNWYTVYSRRVSSLADAIEEQTGYNISTSECSEFFGCIDYSSLSLDKFGTLFKVSKERASYATKTFSDGSKPPAVYQADLVNCGHQFACSFVGLYIYKKLLKYENVTYIKQAGANASGELNADLVAMCSINGVSLTSYISKDRVKLLNEAFSWMTAKNTLSKTYTNGLNNMPSGLGSDYAGSASQSMTGLYLRAYNGSRGVKGKACDCTGLVYAVYRECGFNIQYLNTASLESNSATRKKYWTVIPADAAQPGDIVVYLKGQNSGHAAIIVGREGNNALDRHSYLTIESTHRIHAGNDYYGVMLCKGLGGSSVMNFYNGKAEPSSFRYNTYYIFRHTSFSK